MKHIGIAIVACSLIPSLSFAQEFDALSSEFVAYRSDMFTSTPASVRSPLQEEASAPRIRRSGRMRASSSDTQDICSSLREFGVIQFCLPNGWVAGERAPRTTIGNDGVNDVIGYFISEEGVEKGSIVSVRNTDTERGLRSAYSRKISRSMRIIPGYRKIGIIQTPVAGYDVPLHVFEGEMSGIKSRYYHLAFMHKGLGYGVLATVPAETAVDGHAQMLRTLKSVRVKDAK